MRLQNTVSMNSVAHYAINGHIPLVYVRISIIKNEILNGSVNNLKETMSTVKGKNIIFSFKSSPYWTR